VGSCFAGTKRVVKRGPGAGRSCFFLLVTSPFCLMFDPVPRTPPAHDQARTNAKVAWGQRPSQGRATRRFARLGGGGGDTDQAVFICGHGRSVKGLGEMGPVHGKPSMFVDGTVPAGGPGVNRRSATGLLHAAPCVPGRCRQGGVRNHRGVALPAMNCSHPGPPTTLGEGGGGCASGARARIGA